MSRFVTKYPTLALNQFNSQFKQSRRNNFFKKLFNFGKDKHDGSKTWNMKLTPDSTLKGRCLSMPMIGIGTWQINPDCIEMALTYAAELGYRHIDTAHSFGNQEAIGEALHNLFQCGVICRKEMFISSKLPYYGMRPESVKAYVKNALECLNLRYLDLFMIHYPVGILKKSCGNYETDKETNHIHIWKAMEAEVGCGNVRALGLSNFNMRQIDTICECAKIPPSNLQIEMHLYLQQKELRDYCRKKGITVTAYAPLGSPGLECYLMKHSLNPNNIPPPLCDLTLKLIACKYKKTPSQILLRFLLQQGVAIIPKSSFPDRICKNYDIFDFKLNNCEMEELVTKDMCEKGRMFGANVWVGTEDHIEYPFEKKKENEQDMSCNKCKPVICEKRCE